MAKGSYPLTTEAKALLEKLVQDRDGAVSRLEVAILSIKAALGVPIDWQIHNINDGFVDGGPGGNGNDDNS